MEFPHDDLAQLYSLLGDLLSLWSLLLGLLSASVLCEDWAELGVRKDSLSVFLYAEDVELQRRCEARVESEDRMLESVTWFEVHSFLVHHLEFTYVSN